MESKRLLSSLLVCALILLPVIVYAAGDLPEVGKAAPDFQLTTNEGNQASLKELSMQVGGALLLSEGLYFGLHAGSA